MSIVPVPDLASTVIESSSRSAILLALGAEPRRSRSMLASSLGLSPATVTAHVRTLIHGGLVSELPSASTGGGRPQIPLDVNRVAATVLGIAVNPESMSTVAVDAGGAIILEREDPFDPARAPLEQLAQVVSSCRDALPQHTRLLGIGISVPGIVDRATGTVQLSLVLDWRDLPLAAELGALCRTPVFVDNGVCALAAETLAFGPSEEKDFLLLALGTGVGMGIVIGGSMFRGPNRSSTEFGHVSIDPLGRLCECGNRGCVNAYARSAAILQNAPGSPTTLPAILQQAEAGDDHTVAYLSELGSVIGRAAGATATLLGISTIVVTGESSVLWPFLRESFSDEMRRTTRTLMVPTRIERSDWTAFRQPHGAALLAHAAALALL